MASRSARTMERAFLFLGLHLFPAVLGTTVIPLCGPNETESCTTALVQTENTPRVAHAEFTSCKSDVRNYCMNGECRYHLDLDTQSCKCHMGYFGSRCELSNLEVIKPLSNEYLALTILIVLIFFMAISVAIYFYYRWYDNKRRRLAARSNYEEVATATEKDPALLHV